MSVLACDSRIVLTLDGGGTNFRFSAVRGGQILVDTVTLPSSGEHLDKCLANIVEGFQRVKQRCPEPPVAISFAFPGPADYPHGIIGDLNNLPGFRGGVALGPMLEEKFGIPTYINNDGDLFVYGEAIAGMLPYVNGLLEKEGSPKRFKNLFGVTLGTGFGGGLVTNGELFLGDNSMGMEVWPLYNKLNPAAGAEEGASIRAVRRVYAQQAGLAFAQAPDPKTILQIGLGRAPGHQEAAREAYRQLGVVVGAALAEALTLVDGLAVIGGGVSGAWPLFAPALMAEFQCAFVKPEGGQRPRLGPAVFNLEEPAELAQFLKGETREITILGSQRKLQYDPLQRVGIGLSRLGTSEAVSIGAYAYALKRLDAKA